MVPSPNKVNQGKRAAVAVVSDSKVAAELPANQINAPTDCRSEPGEPSSTWEQQSEIRKQWWLWYDTDRDHRVLGESGYRA